MDQKYRDHKRVKHEVPNPAQANRPRESYPIWRHDIKLLQKTEGLQLYLPICEWQLTESASAHALSLLMRQLLAQLKCTVGVQGVVPHGDDFTQFLHQCGEIDGLVLEKPLELEDQAAVTAGQDQL